MRRELTELEKRIYSDIQRKIQNYYSQKDMEFRENEEPEDTIIDFFSFLYRLIPNVKRKVHYSKELLERIESTQIEAQYVEILDKFADAFENGIDMNGFLSNNIKKVREPDFLLYTWNIYHLHMSEKFVSDPKQMKNNRSSMQLLCIINVHDVYFIDVIKHPTKPQEYFNIRSLDIIVKNGWMKNIGFCEMTDMIPGTLEPKITNDNDLFKLYSQGLNVSFEFEEVGYCSIRPMSCTRRPNEAVQEMLKIDKNILSLNDFDGKYIGFTMGRSKEGKLLGVVEFEINNGEKMRKNIF